MRRMTFGKALGVVPENDLESSASPMKSVAKRNFQNQPSPSMSQDDREPVPMENSAKITGKFVSHIKPDDIMGKGLTQVAEINGASFDGLSKTSRNVSNPSEA